MCKRSCVAEQLLEEFDNQTFLINKNPNAIRLTVLAGKNVYIGRCIRLENSSNIVLLNRKENMILISISTYCESQFEENYYRIVDLSVENFDDVIFDIPEEFRRCVYSDMCKLLKAS